MRTLLLTLIAAAVIASTAAARPRPVGVIAIPRIGLRAVFFNGQATADTDGGPAHYPWTAMPGEGRTVGIAGHRVTHTHPFLLLGDLRRGDLIEVRYGARPRFHLTACYRMTGSTVVPPSDVRVLRNVGVDRLVLTTCTPPHSATYRLVVFARRIEPCT